MPTTSTRLRAPPLGPLLPLLGPVSAPALLFTYTQSPTAPPLHAPPPSSEQSFAGLAAEGDTLVARLLGTGYAVLEDDQSWRPLPVSERTPVDRFIVHAGAWYGAGAGEVTRAPLGGGAVERFTLPVEAETVTYFESIPSAGAIVGATVRHHVFYSFDGENWQTPRLPPMDQVLRIHHHATSGRWIALTRRGAIWTAGNLAGPWERSYVSRSGRGVDFVSTVDEAGFVVELQEGLAGANRRHLLLRSEDGVEWTTTPLAGGLTRSRLEHRFGLYFSLSPQGSGTQPATIATSQDALAWGSEVPVSAPVDPSRIVSTTTGWAAVSLDNTQLYRSTNLVDWELASAPLRSSAIFSAIAGDGVDTLVAAGRRLSVSQDDGATWTDVTPASITDMRQLRDIVWDGQQFVVVGGDRLILLSSDGTQWQEAGVSGLNGAQRLNSVATDGSAYLVSGALGVYRSTDLVNWVQTRQMLGYDANNLAEGRISHANGLFFSSSVDMPVASSADGVSWTVHTGGSDTRRMGKVVHVDGRYHASRDGSVLTTTDDFATWSALNPNIGELLGTFVSEDTAYVRSAQQLFAAVVDDGTAAERLPALELPAGLFSPTGATVHDGRTYLAYPDGQIVSARFTGEHSTEGELRLLLSRSTVDAQELGSAAGPAILVAVERAGGAQSAAEIEIAVAPSSTAAAGEDFDLSGLTLEATLPAGLLGQWVLGTIQPRVDHIAGMSETLELELVSSSGTPVSSSAGNAAVEILAPALDRWLLEHFGGTGAGPEDDSDLDGVPNFAEFALGTDPTQADAEVFERRISPAVVPYTAEIELAQTYRADPRVRLILEENAPGTLLDWMQVAEGAYLGEGHQILWYAARPAEAGDALFLRPRFIFEAFAP